VHHVLFADVSKARRSEFMNSAQRNILQARYAKAKGERIGIWIGFAIGVALALVYKFMFSRYALDALDIAIIAIWFTINCYWDEKKRKEIEELNYKLAGK